MREVKKNLYVQSGIGKFLGGIFWKTITDYNHGLAEHAFSLESSITACRIWKLFNSTPYTYLAYYAVFIEINFKSCK